VVQLLLESAVIGCTPERVSGLLNHTNRKGQSALILACANGWVAGRRGGGAGGGAARGGGGGGGGGTEAVEARGERRSAQSVPLRRTADLPRASRRPFTRSHAAVVETLILNGADPLVLDRSRHNTCLLWAAAHCHAGCVARLLSGRATYRLRSGASCPIAEIPCYDEDGT
jgi:ankyrin repeat protein